MSSAKPKFYGFVVLILFLTHSLAVYAEDPSIHWKITETPHFKIVFPKGYSKVVSKIATFAEKAHILVTKHMGWMPSGKTTIVVSDYTDMANGSATVYFRKTIQVYLTMPDDVSELSDFDDWLWILLLHEYTHIVHMDTKGKLQRIVNKLFGQIWHPNSIQPSWILEGLAIYSESRFSSAGRNRGSIYDMYLRASVNENKILGLDEISSAPVPFPHGAVPYLYGSRFLWYLATKYGEENFKYMSAYYGSRAVPFGLNTASKYSFGKSLESAYAEFKKYLKSKYARQKIEVSARGIIEGKKLTNSGEYKFYPVFNSTDPRLIYYVGTDGHTPTALKSIKINNEGKVLKHKKLFGPVYAAGAPSQKGKNIYFHQVEFYKNTYTFNDLYVLNSNDQIKRITKGKRYSHPSVNPVKNQLAVIRSKGLKSELILTDFAGKTLNILLKGKSDERFFTPVFSHNGNKLAYSIMRKNKRDVEILDLKTGKIFKVTSDTALDVTPSWGEKDRFLYFSSDRTGIFNIYAFDTENKSLYQVTNLMGGAFAPSVSSDGRFLVYAGYNAKGYDIYLLKLNRSLFLPAIAYVSVKPYDKYMPGSVEKLIDVKDYNPLPYILPVMWYFDYGFSSPSAFTASMSGFDPLMHHTWEFSALYNPSDDVHDVDFTYTYGGYWWNFSVELNEGNFFKDNLLVNEKYYDYNWRYFYGSLSMDIPVLRSFRRNVFAFANTSSYIGIPEGPYPVFYPDSKIPDYPDNYYNAYFRVGAYYYDVESSVYALDWEKGEYLSLWCENLWSSSSGNSYNINLDAVVRRKIPIGNHTVFTARLSLGSTLDKDISEYTVGGGFTAPVSLFKPWKRRRNSLKGFTNYTLYGSHFYTSGISVSFPITWVGRGYSTLPVFFRRISAKLYADAGSAFYDFSEAELPLFSAGGEINFHLVEAYYVPIYLTFGLNKGFGEHGEFGTYIKFNSSLSDLLSMKKLFVGRH